MAENVVADQIIGLGCFCFQTIKGGDQIAFLRHDGGGGLSADRGKSEDRSGCWVHFQIERDTTLQEGLEVLNHIPTKSC